MSERGNKITIGIWTKQDVLQLSLFLVDLLDCSSISFLGLPRLASTSKNAQKSERRMYLSRGGVGRDVFNIHLGVTGDFGHVVLDLSGGNGTVRREFLQTRQTAIRV